MSNKRQAEKHVQYLEERVQYLEELNRFTLDTLEMAASLGDFQTSINKLQEPSLILSETRSRIQRLIQFQALAFFLVDEADSDFFLASCEPQRYSSYLKNEVDFLIDNGTFAWTLRERRPVIISTKNYKKQIVLHVMATISRTRGMFIGLLKGGKTNIPDTALSLLSIILLNSSNALESLELYKMIKEINKSLERKENYRTLFEAAPDGVEVLDARGNVVDCNKTNELLLGYSQEEIVGNHTSAFFSDNSRSFFEKKFQTLKDTSYVEGEVELVCSDGSIIPVWRKEKAIYNENAEFVGSVIYNRDISMRKRAEEEKEKLQAQFLQAQKVEAIGTLAAGIAHNFNNLLMAIQGNTSLMLLDTDSNHPSYEMLRNIEKQVKGGANLTSQLLGYARKGRYEIKPISLNQLVEETSDTFGATRKEIRVNRELAEDLSGIKADLGQIEQMLLNLYVNAVDAMPGGGNLFLKTMDVTHKDMGDKPYKVKPGNYILLAVRDTGVGMDEETMKRIFDPFFTTKGMASGTGLGLASVYGIVKAHGGYIDVESKKGHARPPCLSPAERDDGGQGTTFTIYLPASKKKAIEKGQVAKEVLKDSETVLLVDDEDMIIDVSSRMLKRLGYDVLVARSGKEAIEIVSKAHRAEGKEKERYVQGPMPPAPDMVILDMIMPEMGGGETYDRLREINPDIKVLLSSGYSINGQATEILERGCNGFIQKPFNMKGLSRSIRGILDNK